VPVTTQPSAVISHRHITMVRLQQQTTMPLRVQQQEHMPPASIVHRFCIMLQATLSLHEHVTFMPPWHFSNFMVSQRGTIIMFVACGMVLGMPAVAMPPIIPVVIAERPIIIAVMSAILSSTARGRSRARGCA
jgi:hypothetical protein